MYQMYSDSPLLTIHHTLCITASRPKSYWNPFWLSGKSLSYCTQYAVSVLVVANARISQLMMMIYLMLYCSEQWAILTVSDLPTCGRVVCWHSWSSGLVISTFKLVLLPKSRPANPNCPVQFSFSGFWHQSIFLAHIHQDHLLWFSFVQSHLSHSNLCSVSCESQFFTRPIPVMWNWVNKEKLVFVLTVLSHIPVILHIPDIVKAYDSLSTKNVISVCKIITFEECWCHIAKIY